MYVLLFSQIKRTSSSTGYWQVTMPLLLTDILYLKYRSINKCKPKRETALQYHYLHSPKIVPSGCSLNIFVFSFVFVSFGQIISAVLWTPLLGPIKLSQDSVWTARNLTLWNSAFGKVEVMMQTCVCFPCTFLTGFTSMRTSCPLHHSWPKTIFLIFLQFHR